MSNNEENPQEQNRVISDDWKRDGISECERAELFINLNQKEKLQYAKKR